MQRDNDHRIGRRPVLKGAGVTLGALGGLASPVSAGRGSGNGRGGQNDGGRSPLEKDPSLVANLIYSSQVENFGYPDFPVIRIFDPGALFNTTSAEITPNGQVLHYQLQFGTDSKPYVLTHVDGGKYVSRGAVINFDLDDANQELQLPAGKYRATVRDEVHLYGQGGYFDWSVTRTDFFVRPRMVHVGSSLIIVWDEDGPDNVGGRYDNDPDYRSESAYPGGVPEFNSDVLGDDTYNAIYDAGEQLIQVGHSNPGGQ